MTRDLSTGAEALLVRVQCARPASILVEACDPAAVRELERQGLVTVGRVESRRGRPGPALLLLTLRGAEEVEA